MNIKTLNKKISKILGFKVNIKSYAFIDNDLMNIVLSVNAKANFKKLVKILKGLDFINFSIYINYQHDISFINIDIITFYDDTNDIDDIDDIDIIINDDLFNDIDIIDALNTIDDIDDTNDIDDIDVKALKYIKNYKHYQKYDINNNVIDNLTTDDIDDIDNLNNEYLKFNRHMIKNMLLKRDVKGLNNLLDKGLTKKGHLKFNKHKKAIKKIKNVILDKYNTNTFKDEYLLKDYQYLSTINYYYYNLYDYDVLKDEYDINIKGRFNYNDIEYYNNNDDDVKSKKMIKLVLSLH